MGKLIDGTTVVPMRLVPINLLFDLFSNAPLWSLFSLCVRIFEFVFLRIFGVVLRQHREMRVRPDALA